MQPNAPYGVDPMTGMPFSDKSKMVAGLLQIFLGSFGAGRFYTGHMGLAIAQIAVTWLTCGVGVHAAGVVIAPGPLAEIDTLTMVSAFTLFASGRKDSAVACGPAWPLES